MLKAIKEPQSSRLGRKKKIDSEKNQINSGLPKTNANGTFLIYIFDQIKNIPTCTR